MNNTLIEVFCDGGCRGNQHDINIGGWGVYIKQGDREREYYGATENTTNNRMELQACIEALEILKYEDAPIMVMSDSMYVVQGVNKWHISWVLNGWKTSKGEPVSNSDLWKKLLDLIASHHRVDFGHCKGHSDNEGNNRADYLVNVAMTELLERRL